MTGPARSGRQEDPQVAAKPLRVVMELAPRDADDAPPGRGQRAVMGSIGLEGGSRAVGGVAIELGDQPLLMPHAVGLDPLAADSHGDVRGGQWQPQPGEEGEKPILQLAAGGASQGSQ